MASKELNYKNDKNQVLSWFLDYNYWLKNQIRFWNYPISKREKPKYKLMGKPRIYHVQENLNGQAQVRRARFQIYLTKIKTDFQTHKDPVFSLIQSKKQIMTRFIFKVFKKIKKVLNNYPKTD